MVAVMVMSAVGPVCVDNRSTRAYQKQKHSTLRKPQHGLLFFLAERKQRRVEKKKGGEKESRRKDEMGGGNEQKEKRREQRQRKRADVALSKSGRCDDSAAAQGERERERESVCVCVCVCVCVPSPSLPLFPPLRHLSSQIYWLFRSRTRFPRASKGFQGSGVRNVRTLVGKQGAARSPQFHQGLKVHFISGVAVTNAVKGGLQRAEHPLHQAL